jgi:hypothetical protein
VGRGGVGAGLRLTGALGVRGEGAGVGGSQGPTKLLIASGEFSTIAGCSLLITSMIDGTFYMDSATRKYIRAAEEQGWKVEVTRKGYLAFYPLDKEKTCVIRAKTPSDWRADRAFLSEMRRRGFIWPWTRQAKKEAG